MSNELQILGFQETASMCTVCLEWVDFGFLLLLIVVLYMLLWLHIKSSARVLKNTNAQAPPHTKLKQNLRGEAQASVPFKAPQMLLMCNQIWEPPLKLFSKQSLERMWMSACLSFPLFYLPLSKGHTDFFFPAPWVHKSLNCGFNRPLSFITHWFRHTICDSPGVIETFGE